MRRTLLAGLLLGGLAGCASGGERPAVALPDTQEARAEATECDQKHDKCVKERIGHDPSYCEAAYRRCYGWIAGSTE